jgi:hypothetical protein
MSIDISEVRAASIIRAMSEKGIRIVVVTHRPDDGGSTYL